MTRLLIFSLFVFLNSASYAQIAYEESYSTALKKARITKKPIFILLNPKGIPNVTNKVGLNGPEATQLYDTSFVNVRLTSGEPDASLMASLFKITATPSYIFIDRNEQMLFKWHGAKTEEKFFIDIGKEVLDRLEKHTTLSDFDQKYENGEISRKFLKDYISLRIKTGTFDNAHLIEKYVTYLTIAEFNEPGEILFIFKSGPILSGNAYKLLYNNSKLTREIFATLPLSERIAINRRIGDNTLKEAIATRNLSQAMQSADFASNSHGNDYKAADKRSTWNMMEYYKAVKDTANFFLSSTRYYDTHYMSVSLDSIRRANVKANKTGNSMDKDQTALRLNDAAWAVYEQGTKNYLYLTKAMLWSKRSIEIDPDPNYYDTLAHIFYRLGLYDEAILNQNKSIKFTKLQPALKDKIPGLTLELKKMRERKL